MPGANPISAKPGTHWLESAKIQTLSGREIHVWRINLAGDAKTEERLKTCLSREECERAARFQFAQDSHRFIIRRAALRQLLAGYMDLPLDAINLGYRAHGKPFLENQAQPGGLRFSCSHSEDLALIAVSRGREIGVDVELHRPLPEAEELARAHFSHQEIAELAQAPEAQKEEYFFNCWTRKEAFVKAIGLGLSFPLNQFSVSASPNEPAALRSVEDDPRAVENWSLQALDAGAAYSAALAFEGKDAVTKFFG